MAKSNETEAKTHKELKPKATEQVSSSPVPLYKNTLLINRLAMAIALGALLIVLYTIQFNKALQNKLLSANEQVTLELQHLKEKQIGILDEANSKTDSIRQTQSELQNKIDTLNKQIQTSIAQEHYQSMDWQLLKARYYLEVAQINTHWSDSNEASITLLEQADTLLNQLNTPKVYAIRQSIAKEIGQLKAIPNIDSAGILSRLDALQSQVNQLRLPLNLNQNDELPQSPTTAHLSNWQARVQTSLNSLKKLVVIRRNEEELQPLMSPLLESLLKESIYLNLQEAQWAVLNHNTQVYQLALKQAGFNLRKAFNEQTQNLAAILKQIEELKRIKINQEKPQPGQALILLNHFIDSKGLLIHANPNSEQEEN